MIPLRDQEYIKQRFAQELEGRVKIDYFTQRASKLYIPGREECATCEETRKMLEEVAALSERITLTVHEFSESLDEAGKLKVDRVPGIVLRGPVNRPLRFFGIPAGNEFPTFIETVIAASKSKTDLAPETAKQLRRLKDRVAVTVYVTPTCGYCPGVVRAAYRLGLASAQIEASAVEISEFPALAQQLGVRAVPLTVIDNRSAITGAMDEDALLEAVLKVAEGGALSAAGGRAGASSATTEGSQQPAAGGLVLPR